jgi:nitroimidazol reductase NimA-like FMN-containing flavoprotein (pyridoxamine 5'-phosphate oxidase superfamily)
MSEEIVPTAATRLRRDERGSFDRDLIYSIIDEAMFCHVGFVHDDRPVVIPMLHARLEDQLLLHGAPATRLFRLLGKAADICVTITLLDGLVLARSAFEHSANYRSVVILGRPHRIRGLEERTAALDAFTDKLVPGRRPHLRPMTEDEVKLTAVLRLPISEASAKLRTGPPKDKEPDYELPIWAGVVPFELSRLEPIPDPRNLEGLEVPEHIKAWGTKA